MLEYKEKREKTKKTKKSLSLKRALQINQQFQQQFAFRTLWPQLKPSDWNFMQQKNSPSKGCYIWGKRNI